MMLDNVATGSLSPTNADHVIFIYTRHIYYVQYLHIYGSVYHQYVRNFFLVKTFGRVIIKSKVQHYLWTTRDIRYAEYKGHLRNMKNQIVT